MLHGSHVGGAERVFLKLCMHQTQAQLAVEVQSDRGLHHAPWLRALLVSFAVADLTEYKPFPHATQVRPQITIDVSRCPPPAAPPGLVLRMLMQNRHTGARRWLLLEFTVPCDKLRVLRLEPYVSNDCAVVPNVVANATRCAEATHGPPHIVVLMDAMRLEDTIVYDLAPGRTLRTFVFPACDCIYMAWGVFWVFVAAYAPQPAENEIHA